MDDSIKKLAKDQRVALARVVSDLILADSVIANKEVETFASLFGGVHNRNLFFLAQRISFAQALKMLVEPHKSIKGSGGYNRYRLGQNANIATEAVVRTANSDGYCSPEEALILLAIEYYLRHNDTTCTKYDIQSFRISDLSIGERFVLYADMSNSSQALKVEQNYNLICSTLSSIGFEFVYVPKLVELFEKQGFDQFQTLLMYIFPDIPQSKVEEIYGNIMKMTTREFVTRYLNHKLGFKMESPAPSLYVMVGKSTVLGDSYSPIGLAYDTYANFLKITIGDNDILSVISQFVYDYNQKVSYNHYSDLNPGRNKLLFNGFHKAFFRLVALAKDNPNKYNINIDTANGVIFIEDRKLRLPRGMAAIYATIICYSLFGEKKGLPNRKIYNGLSIEEQQKIQRVYERICALMKNCDTPTPKAALYNSLHTRISTINTALDEAAHKGIIGQIQIGTGNYIKTKVPTSVVTIDKTSILEHKEWMSIVESL